MVNKKDILKIINLYKTFLWNEQRQGRVILYRETTRKSPSSKLLLRVTKVVADHGSEFSG